MGFLDNSGDIILDAVLTDTGRYRLAKGDGSFRIAKFALSDDEIDYGKYNKNDSRGSAYYDLDIMQTPIFEAFTNNASSMKSKLLTISRNNLLYLPVIKPNRNSTNTQWYTTGNVYAFVVAVDDDTETAVGRTGTTRTTGVIFGNSLDTSTFIRCEQGLDTTEVPPTLGLDPELVETQYIVELDSRLGNIYSINGTNKKPASVSYVDDDSIASYFFSLGSNPEYVMDNWPGKIPTTQNSQNASILEVRGPRGTRLEFTIGAAIETMTSTYLFTRLGSTTTKESTSVYFIDTHLRVTGATTGYAIEIPIRIVKKV